MTALILDLLEVAIFGSAILAGPVLIWCLRRDRRERVRVDLAAMRARNLREANAAYFGHQSPS